MTKAGSSHPYLLHDGEGRPGGKGAWASLAAPVLAFLAALILSQSPFPARAAEVPASRGDLLKQEKNLEDMRRQIREERENIRGLAEKETSILGELERIDRKIAAKREDLAKVEATLRKLAREIDYSSFYIGRLEAERQGLMARLGRRLRAMYKMQNEGVLNVLFSSDMMEEAELGRRTKYLSLLMNNDRALVEASRKSIERLLSEKKRYEGLKAGLEAEKEAARERKVEAEALKRGKTALLDDVKSGKERSLDAVRELEDAAIELSTLIRALKADEDETETRGFASMKGSLPMPVEGNVVSFYGRVRHPRFNTVTFNNGIVIEARSGSPVRSVYDGKVAYSGWLKGYGQIMILEHGGGFYTLFARLQKTLKDKGASVRKGDEIALVGDSGPESSSGLYFEVRERGVPKDPLSWLASR